jgi:DNA-binding protein H-NS
MTTLTELEQQLAELTAKVDAARSDLREHAATQIKLLMAQYDVTAADLNGAFNTPKSKAKSKAKVKTNGVTPPKSKGTKPAKYADPESGLTWSGMGHEPYWIKGKKRDKFLIQ